MRSESPSFITRIRRNHALEHATMHILMRDEPTLRLVGRSDWDGFTIYGDVDTQELRRAVAEGLVRLGGDERWLAVHPRCGTNLAVATLLAGGVALNAFWSPVRSRWGRFLSTTVAAIAALLAARPLGTAAQRYVTTTPHIGGLRVRAIRRYTNGKLAIHRVSIASGA